MGLRPSGKRVHDFEIYGSYYNNEAMRGQLAESTSFSANHPWVVTKLREKPSLANDQDFLHDNPELRAPTSFCNRSFGLIHGA